MQDRLRFLKIYGVPPGYSPIAKTPLDHLYQVEKVLDGGGRGANAIGGLNDGVFLVRHINSGSRYVQKCIPANTERSWMLEREILLLEALRHTNIVKFVQACITDTVPRQMTLYMYYYDLGSLNKMIKRYTSHRKNCQVHSSACLRVPEAFVWHVLHSLANALQFLHYGIDSNDRRDPPQLKSKAEWPPVMHRDIKPDNILLRAEPGLLYLDDNPSRPVLYPHRPFNIEDTGGSHRTYPKVVLADFVSAILLHCLPPLTRKFPFVFLFPSEPHETL